MQDACDTFLWPTFFQPFAQLAGSGSRTSPTRVLKIAAGTGIATAVRVDRLPETPFRATAVNEAMESWSATGEPSHLVGRR